MPGAKTINLSSVRLQAICVALRVLSGVAGCKRTRSKRATGAQGTAARGARFHSSQVLVVTRRYDPRRGDTSSWVTSGGRHHLEERQGRLLPNSTGGHSSETSP